MLKPWTEKKFMFFILFFQLTGNIHGRGWPRWREDQGCSRESPWGTNEGSELLCLCTSPELPQGTWARVCLESKSLFFVSGSFGYKLFFFVRMPSWHCPPQSNIRKSQQRDKICGSPNWDHSGSVCNEDRLALLYLVRMATREVSTEGGGGAGQALLKLQWGWVDLIRHSWVACNDDPAFLTEGARTAIAH